jgi:SAM-dependent methyltransferase
MLLHGRQLKSVARDLTPPFLLKLSRRLSPANPARPQTGGEKGADWYDRAFEDSEGQNVHYTESPYYPIWVVIMDRVRSERPRTILEIACGAGQLARALHDSGLIDAYKGFDFSPKRIESARMSSPELSFEVADVFSSNILESSPYEITIATEFLEHIQEDLAVVKRLKPGTRFLGTVPNYPWISHVRHFKSVEEVTERYGSYFDGLDVSPILRKKTGETIFVMDGNKS